MNAKEVLAVREEERRRDGGPPVHRLARHLAALLLPDQRDRRGAPSKTAWASTARRSAAGRRSTRATCSWSRIPTTAFIDPFFEHPTLVLICNIVDPITREPYSRDPRYIATKAENYLKQTGIGDTAYFGPEAEFFIFDDVRFSTGPDHGFYERRLGRGRVEHRAAKRTGGNLGYKPRAQGGLLPGAAHRLAARTSAPRWCSMMQKLGIAVEAQHHEVATAGQAEIDMRFEPLRRRWPTSCCSTSTWSRTWRARTARRRPSCPSRSSTTTARACTCHQSIWKDGKPLFAGDGYAGFSELGLHYIGGILKHARALAAFTNPTTNSYKRLVPGFEAPVNLAYSSRNRSAALPHPDVLAEPEGQADRGPLPGPVLQPLPRLLGDADGGPRRHREQDRSRRAARQEHLRAARRKRRRAFRRMPAQPRGGARRRSQEDHEFLLKGDVFTEDVIETWIELQARERGRPGSAAAPPARVRALLRYLNTTTHPNTEAPSIPDGASWFWVFDLGVGARGGWGEAIGL